MEVGKVLVWGRQNGRYIRPGRGVELATAMQASTNGACSLTWAAPGCISKITDTDPRTPLCHFSMTWGKGKIFP